MRPHSRLSAAAREPLPRRIRIACWQIYRLLLVPIASLTHVPRQCRDSDLRRRWPGQLRMAPDGSPVRQTKEARGRVAVPTRGADSPRAVQASRFGRCPCGPLSTQVGARTCYGTQPWALSRTSRTPHHACVRERTRAHSLPLTRAHTREPTLLFGLLSLCRGS